MYMTFVSISGQKIDSFKEYTYIGGLVYPRNSPAKLSLRELQ
jgi:hypothetical protein